LSSNNNILNIVEEMKDIEKMVDRYKMQKDQAEEFQNDQRRHTERKAILEAEMQQLQKTKTELDAKLKQSMDQYREAEKTKAEIQRKKVRMEELERNRHDLESDITRVITASVEDLEREIQRFQITKVSIVLFFVFFLTLVYNLIFVQIG
jgi:chromosome segregation ATPase